VFTNEIDKTYDFAASHYLEGLPEGHKCSRLHGHTYYVTVTVGSNELHGPGFVTDFATLAPFRNYINTLADHQHLNEVLDVNPTAENIARHLAEWFIANLEPDIDGHLVSVRVAESPTSGATYIPPRVADTR
jgi:6-pyruvoyltetrahydropterin/6-carboxytetrahydropterin synthase